MWLLHKLPNFSERQSKSGLNMNKQHIHTRSFPCFPLIYVLSRESCTINWQCLVLAIWWKIFNKLFIFFLIHTSVRVFSDPKSTSASWRSAPFRCFCDAYSRKLVASTDEYKQNLNIARNQEMSGALSSLICLKYFIFLLIIKWQQGMTDMQ